MLIRFSVENFLSFKGRVVFDLSADALKEKEGYVHVPYQHNSKMSILKSAVIYGYNAFGKSNLIKAYSTFKNLILNSFSITNISDVQVEPFRLNTATINEPSIFEATFIIRQTKYRYGFKIRGKEVIGEWLHYADGPVRENSLFVRGGQNFRDVSKLWNKSADNKIEQTKIFTKSNHLFLSVLLAQEGIPRVDDISNWLKGNLILNANYSSAINDGAAQIYSNEEYRSLILKFLDNADLGFTNIFEKVSNLINDKGLHSDLVNTLYDIEKTNFELFTHHKLMDEQYVFQKMIEFHLLKNESSGSIKYFIIACFLAYALKKGQLIFVDELDASLHTQLLTFLVETFNSDMNNVNGAQLIFTTHNTVLLDNNLRRDQIWFVDKNEYGESSLHKGHTPENPLRINRSIEQDYRGGKIKKGISNKAVKANLPSLFDDQNSSSSST